MGGWQLPDLRSRTSWNRRTVGNAAGITAGMRDSCCGPEPDRASVRTFDPSNRRSRPPVPSLLRLRGGDWGSMSRRPGLRQRSPEFRCSGGADLTGLINLLKLNRLKINLPRMLRGGVSRAGVMRK
jgi:hypothetical protein